MAALENVIADVLDALRPLLAGSTPTPHIVGEMLERAPHLDNQLKQLLGLLSSAAGAKGIPEASRWGALRKAIADGLLAVPPEAVATVRMGFTDEITQFTAAAEVDWLAFVPLAASDEIPPRMNFQLDSVKVRAGVVPMPAPDSSLKELADRFGGSVPNLGDHAPGTACFVTVVRGASVDAAKRALAQLADVRDALRFATLMANPTSPTYGGTATGGRRRVDILMCPTDGGRPTVEPVRGEDVGFGADPTGLADGKKRTAYDRALRLLADHPPAMPAKDLLPALRLARSIRLMSRAWVQASFDVRYLLRLVAVETLLNQKEDIAETVSDVGARVMAKDLGKRSEIAIMLKDAYDLRSRLVHDGELPSYSPGRRDKTPAKLEEIVFQLWAELVERFFNLAERDMSVADFEAGLHELRGTTKFNFGRAWDEAFGPTAGAAADA